MPRCARAVSITGYYHVFDRGNSKQIIFEDDSDRYRNMRKPLSIGMFVRARFETGLFRWLC